MSDFIVDASVVAKWFVTENDSDRARSLTEKRHYLRAPDLLLSELANVVWKRAMRGEVTSDEGESILKIFLERHIDVTLRLLPARILIKQAWQIAHAEGRSLYDSLYLATAVQARCRLITADARFVRAIKNPMLKPHIVSLNDAGLEL